MPIINLLWDDLIPEFVENTGQPLGQRLILMALQDIKKDIEELKESLED